MAPIRDISPARRPPRWLASLAVSLLIFGIGLRFTQLDGKFHWNDEIITALRTAGHTIWDFKGSYFDDRIIPFSDVQYFQQIKPGSSFQDTVDGLAVEDAKHTPLYFVIARAGRLLFGQFFETPVAGLRAVSAALSLLIFPSLYWFCRELFPKLPAVAPVALGIFALSPVHLLYAQEARAYSLWTAAVLLSSAALLRAMAQPSWLRWAGYVGAVTIGIYSQTLFALVLLSHGGYVLLQGWPHHPKEATQPPGWWGLPQLWWQFGGAVLGICMLFLPWIDDILGTMTMLKANTGWVTEAIPRHHVVKQWLVGFSSTLFDWDSLSLVKIVKGTDAWTDYLPQFCVVLGLATAFIYTLRQAEPRAGRMLLCLVASPVICLMLPDILWGGQRSAAPRYWLAAYCALQIAVAYVIGFKLSQQKARLWKILLLGIFVVQALSCVRLIQAPIWWNKHFYNFPAVAEVINAAPNALVISDPTGANPGCIIALGELVRPGVDLQLVTPPEIPPLPEGYGSVFFFDTYGEVYGSLVQLYEAEQGVRAIAAGEGILWQVIPKA
ncbi:MAG: hypothetical protein HC824_12650 [Synechococcales cyanobacterium RM1_1_8]|nr:hypothetical protein [Synechococcales cyanobacterium RM1_1_8]